MDQGTIAIMKANYRKITFSKAHETHETLSDFLKEYTILDAVKNLGLAWSQVTSKAMRGVWQPLLQRPNQPLYAPPVEEIVEDIVNLGNQLGIEFEKDDIKEGLGFDNKDISNEELFEIDQARAYEEDEEEVEDPTEALKDITSERLGMIISQANKLSDLVKEFDPIVERQSKAQSCVQDFLKCYKDEQKESVKKRKQTNIGDFFGKRPKE